MFSILFSIKDGSCNGLQHYAAIGRDKLGASSVNLVPASKPQDVYSEIAALVERKRAEDAAKGVEIAQVLDGFIRRKVFLFLSFKMLEE